jgi:hypothetical protein
MTEHQLAALIGASPTLIIGIIWTVALSIQMIWGDEQ